jgi:[acyl-carrier-protein] S-malonyltransferase
MAALIGIEEETAKQICSDTRVEVCNLNAPGQVVIGGRSDAVAQAMTLALERGAQRGVRLRVGGAFHTSMMQPAAEGMARAVANAPIRDATVPLVANTTAALIQREGDLRDELVQQLTRPVRWQQSMEELRSEGVHQVIEFGPGRVLTGLARRIDRSFAVHNVADMAGAVLEPSTPAPP